MQLSQCCNRSGRAHNACEGKEMVSESLRQLQERVSGYQMVLQDVGDGAQRMRFELWEWGVKRRKAAFDDRVW